jgi:hypothetical protein
MCDEHEKTPPEGGVFSVLLERRFVAQTNLSNLRSDVSERVGYILPTAFNRVLKLGQTAVDTRFTRVYAFLKPLETSGDGDGDVIAVLVNDSFYEFEVFLL